MKSRKLNIICFMMVIMLILSFSGCGSSNDRAGQPEGSNEGINGTGDTGMAGIRQSEESIEGGNGAQEAEADAESGNSSNILIVYFTAAENSGVDAVSSASYSMRNGEAVGRLRILADMIQENTGGDLFSIQTDVVYPADGGELIDYAAQEQSEDARPGLTSHIEDLDRYETVFIGYPNWWADMPQALYSFFDEYDFSGKTIIPFNVHNGSRFSRTISTIQELEPDAVVVEDGFTVSEHNVTEAGEDVADWLEGLGF